MAKVTGFAKAFRPYSPSSRTTGRPTSAILSKRRISPSTASPTVKLPPRLGVYVINHGSSIARKISRYATRGQGQCSDGHDTNKLV